MSINKNKINGLVMPHMDRAEWEDGKNVNKDFFDDGTMSFFWRAHRITALVVFSFVLFYVALCDKAIYSPGYNIKRGIIAVVVGFVVFGVTITPDGPFRRPHPALWRFMFVLSIVYEMFLIFLIFQNVDDARRLISYLDSDLGHPLPEKSYGGNCLIYDSGNPEDPFHNFWDKMDIFVLVHLFGWWAKTLLVRDWWLCLVTSVLFELLEYLLEHQLPNFSECWWDHWILDFLVCNGLGIFLGLKTLKYLSMKTYHWRGLWTFPTYKGKLLRIFRQFTPYIWTNFDWRPTLSLKRWLSTIFLITVILFSELNTFTLKFVLWIPASHNLCLMRLSFVLMWGAVSIRDFYQFLDDPKCRKMGPQALVMATILVTEVLIVLKFDWDTFTKPPPPHIRYLLLAGFVFIFIWTFWYFYLQRFLHHLDQKLFKKNKIGKKFSSGGRFKHD